MRRLLAALALALALASGAAPTAGALDRSLMTFESGLKGGGIPADLAEEIPDGLKGGG
jgi:hypothetical protein